MRDLMRTELPLAALMMAAATGRAQWPGSSNIRIVAANTPRRLYRRQLAVMAATPSMSRPGCCSDLAPMESFFPHAEEVELVPPMSLGDQATRPDARPVRRIQSKGYYNRRRIHSAIGYKTPEQAERLAA